MWSKGGEPSGQKTHKLVYLENFDKAPTQQYNQHACLKQKTKRISHVVCADAKGAVAAWVTPSVNKNQLASIGKCICWHEILSFLKIMKYKLTEKDSWYVYKYILMHLSQNTVSFLMFGIVLNDSKHYFKDIS